MTSEKENKAPWLREDQPGVSRIRASPLRVTRRFGELKHPNITFNPAPIPLIFSKPDKIVGSSSQIEYSAVKKACSRAVCTPLDLELLLRCGQAVIEQPIDACRDPPPAQLSVSPDFVKRSWREVAEQGDACLGAGHFMGGIRDRRKSKPRGLLTAGSDSRGPATVSEEIRASQEALALPGPIVASVTWILLGNSGTEPDCVESSQKVSHSDYRRYSSSGRASKCLFVNKNSAPLKNERLNKFLVGDVYHQGFYLEDENTRQNAIDASEDSFDWETCADCSEDNTSFCDYVCACCHKSLDLRSSKNQQFEFSSLSVLPELMTEKIHPDPDRGLLYREDSLATNTQCSSQLSLRSCRFLKLESKNIFECATEEPERHMWDSVSIFDPETRGMLKLLKCSNRFRGEHQRTSFHTDQLDCLATVSSKSKDIHEANHYRDGEHKCAGFSKPLAVQGKKIYISSHIKADAKLSEPLAFLNKNKIDERLLDCKVLISLLKQKIPLASQSIKCNCRPSASFELELSSPEAWGGRTISNKQGCPIKMHVNLKEMLASSRRDLTMTNKSDKLPDIDSQLECNIANIKQEKSDQYSQLESSMIATNMCKTGYGATLLMLGLVIVGYLYKRGICQSG